jgi:predicted ester cyclase
MSEEKNKGVFRKLIEEAFNKGDLSAIDDLVTADFNERQNGIEPPTVDGLKRSINGLRAALPDLHLSFEDVTADGDRVWARLTVRGTHRGPIMGIAPTGKVTAIDEGRIAEHWGVAVRFGLMQQLGAIPGSPHALPRSSQMYCSFTSHPIAIVAPPRVRTSGAPSRAGGIPSQS